MSMFDEEFNNQGNNVKNQFLTPKRVEMSIEWVSETTARSFQRIVVGTENYSNALIDFLLKEFNQGDNKNAVSLVGNIIGKDQNGKKGNYGSIFGSTAEKSIAFLKLEKNFFGYERILSVLKELFHSTSQNIGILHILPRTGSNILYRISTTTADSSSSLASLPLLPVGEIINHHFTASLLNYSQGRSFHTHALIGIANPDNFVAFAQLLETLVQTTQTFLSLENSKNLKSDKESMEHIHSIVYASTSPLYL